MNFQSNKNLLELFTSVGLFSFFVDVNLGLYTHLNSLKVIQNYLFFFIFHFFFQDKKQSRFLSDLRLHFFSQTFDSF